MNEGIMFGYVQSAATGAPMAGATVTLDRVDTTQEINMGRLKLYDVYENELVPPRTPSSISGSNGRFAVWFRWDETDASVLAGPGGQTLSYHGRVIYSSIYGGMQTERVWRFRMFNMRHRVAPMRILGAAGAPSFSNAGPPGARLPWRNGPEDAPSDQIFNFLISSFTSIVDTRFDPGAARSPDNYWLVASTNVLYVPD